MSITNNELTLGRAIRVTNFAGVLDGIDNKEGCYSKYGRVRRE
jgi:hypothetical protein